MGPGKGRRSVCLHAGSSGEKMESAVSTSILSPQSCVQLSSPVTTTSWQFIGSVASLPLNQLLHTPLHIQKCQYEAVVRDMSIWVRKTAICIPDLLLDSNMTLGKFLTSLCPNFLSEKIGVEIGPPCYGLNCVSTKSYVEALAYDVMVFGGRTDRR